jgi:hypothetical protein
MTTNTRLPELTRPPIFIVLMEDEPLHTDEHPYCDDMTCPCQDDLAATLEQDPEDMPRISPRFQAMMDSLLPE